MATVKIGVASRAEVSARVKAAFDGKKQGNRISFASLDLMHRILTPNRWNTLRAMMGAGPIGMRELARRLDRDVKAVHTDVQALLNAGVINRAGDKVELRRRSRGFHGRGGVGALPRRAARRPGFGGGSRAEVSDDAFTYYPLPLRPEPLHVRSVAA